MPRTLVRAPEHNRARSLGWLCTAWCEYFVRHGPGAIKGHPVRHGDEYTGLFVDIYAVGDNPQNRHMLYDSVFFSRPKGCDKSGIGARLALFEGLGPARFGGWAERDGGAMPVYEDPWGFGFYYEYVPGEPMGVHVESPGIRCMATEVGQVGNVYKTIKYNLTERDVCPLAHVPGIDVGLERVILPGDGEIIVSTASSSSKDGGRETFVIFDESHRYTTRELHEMYEVVVNNLDKRKMHDGTWYFECTTMFAPGENSVAEATYAEAEALREGRKRTGQHRLLYDHRWGDVKDLKNEAELRIAIREAYGEALSWMSEDSLVAAFFDTRRTPANNRRFFLNAQTSASDSWVAPAEWDACGRPGKSLQDGDLVCLGLDGSINDDSTCLVAVRVDDGHCELLAAFEKPLELAEADEWQVDRYAVDAAVHQAMHRFEVCGFYADPAHWQDSLAQWTQEFGEQMRVRASERRPLHWWTNRSKDMVLALEGLHEAIREERVTFTPADDRTGREAELSLVLRSHVINARRRPSRAGLQIGKVWPKSPLKIDAAVALTLAWRCRSDAVAKGIQSQSAAFYVPKRLR